MMLLGPFLDKGLRNSVLEGHMGDDVLRARSDKGGSWKQTSKGVATCRSTKFADRLIKLDCLQAHIGSCSGAWEKLRSHSWWL